MSQVLRKISSPALRVLGQQSKIEYGHIQTTGQLRNVTNQATLLNRTPNRSTEEIGMASVSTSSQSAYSSQKEPQRPQKLDANDLDTLHFLFKQYEETWPLGVTTTKTASFQKSED